MGAVQTAQTIDLNTLLMIFGLLAQSAIVIRFFVKMERRFTRIETALHIHFKGARDVFDNNSGGDDD